ncbi:MAG: T9SS type A sorting domain-containing protein [Chitinophagales bacterium]|nr:T9SS type A sorting domain-containing protein [Chitinophagales bacterium]
MKFQLLRNIFVAATMLFSTQAFAQCPTAPGQGFFPSDDYCFEQGVFTQRTWAFQCYEEFTVGGLTVNIDSIRIDSINYLPCGIGWATSNADNRFSALETGCFLFAGTTTDSIGLYNVDLIITAYLSTGDSLQVNSRLGGVSMFVNVVAPSTTCPATQDTTGARETASCRVSPYTSIKELSADIASMDVVPNPMNGNGTIELTMQREAKASIEVFDLLGKKVAVVLNNEQVYAGNTRYNLNLSDASNGIYFVKLTINGASSIKRVVLQ